MSYSVTKVLLTKSNVVVATHHMAAPLQHSGPRSSGTRLSCPRLSNGLMGIIMVYSIALCHQRRLSIHPLVVLGHQGPPDKSDVVFATRHPAAPLQHSGPRFSGTRLSFPRLSNGLMGIIMGYIIALCHQCRLSIHPPYYRTQSPRSS